MHSSPDLWSGIFFYDMPEGRTVESAVDTLGEEFKSQISPSDRQVSSANLRRFGAKQRRFPVYSKTMQLESAPSTGTVWLLRALSVTYWRLSLHK
jgi:hypothetical protein